MVELLYNSIVNFKENFNDQRKYLVFDLKMEVSPYIVIYDDLCIPFMKGYNQTQEIEKIRDLLDVWRQSFKKYFHYERR